MTQAGKITWPNTGTLRVNFLGDSVGYRGSFASTLENSWRYLMRARLESVGPVTYGSYDHTHNANGNTVFTSVSNVSGGEDLTFVMLEPAFGGYTTDGFHPNDTGHRAIYNRYRIALSL